MGEGRGEGAPDRLADRTYEFIEFQKASLVFECFILSSRNSIASTVPIGLRMRRRTHMRERVPRSTRSSSLRVPDLLISIAGNTRLSATRRSRTISELPVPL